MNKIVKGLIAGLVATIVLSLLMMIKAKMGLMPNLNIIHMLASKMGGAAVMGWTAHIAIGLGYGVIFGLFYQSIPSESGMMKGILLGIAGWLIMMIAIMPMMGAGMFASNMGMVAAVMTLVLHLIFGAVLGYTFDKLNKEKTETE